MTNTTAKKKMSDMRVHLSDKAIKALQPREKQYSVGDDEVIGLRVFVYPFAIET